MDPICVWNNYDLVTISIIPDAFYFDNEEQFSNFNNLFKTLNLRRLQIYGEITNAFTLKNYSGLDPEINMSGINMGIDLGAWPTPRRYMFGINVGF